MPSGPLQRLSRRGVVLGGLASLAFGQGAVAAPASPLRVGVPGDVEDDCQRFLNGRDPVSIKHFGGPHARRDVMELVWLQREIQRQPDAPEVRMVRIDSYERLLFQLKGGHIDLIGTSAWRSDIDKLGPDRVEISAAMIPKGRFVVGVYTSSRNQAALRARSVEELRQLRFVSNSQWSQDWSALGRLQITPHLDVKTWRQMVALVDAGRADAVLAPFQPSGATMALVSGGVALVPIRGVAVALDGSRHVACSALSSHGRWLAARVFPLLAAQAASGALKQAYEECGFLNPQTRDWLVL